MQPCQPPTQTLQCRGWQKDFVAKLGLGLINECHRHSPEVSLILLHPPETAKHDVLRCLPKSKIAFLENTPYPDLPYNVYYKLL